MLTLVIIFPLICAFYNKLIKKKKQKKNHNAIRKVIPWSYNNDDAASFRKKWGKKTVGRKLEDLQWNI